MSTISHRTTRVGIDQRTQNIVDGYIRMIQKIFPWRQNIYYTIPPLINSICLNYYHIPIRFNEEQHGENLLFINDKIVKKVKDSGHSMCIFKHKITSSMCNIFRIEYTIKDAKKEYCPYFGYFIADKSLEISKIGFQEVPGYGVNIKRLCCSEPYPAWAT